MVRNGDLTVSQHRQQRGFTTSVGSEQTVTTATVQLEHGILQHFTTEERDGKVGNLDVPGAWMHGQRPGAGSGLRVDSRLFIQLGAKCLFLGHLGRSVGRTVGRGLVILFGALHKGDLLVASFLLLVGSHRGCFGSGKTLKNESKIICVLAPTAI